MLSLGGVPLIVPDGRSELTDLVAWARENIDPADAMPWLRRSWPGPGLVDLTLPTGFEIPRAFRFNTFVYPTWGASRWGYGSFFCSSANAELIRKATAGKGTISPVTLSMSTPHWGVTDPKFAADFSVDVKVYVASIVPLGRVDPGQLPTADGSVPAYYNGLCLVTVVDERYYFWGCAATVTWPAIASWRKLLDNAINAVLANVVGSGHEENSTDTPSADYALPSRVFANISGQPAPPVVDAALANIGWRLRRTYDGKYSTVDWKKATRLRLADDADKYRQNRGTTAGGDRFKGAPLGGDYGQVIPGAFNFPYAQYPCRNGAAMGTTAHGWSGSVSVSAADALAKIKSDAKDLYAAFDMANVVTDPKRTVTFRNTLGAFYDGNSSDVMNKDELDALSLRVAVDYIGWRLMSFDRVYFGIVDVEPDGLIDTILFSYMGQDCGAARGGDSSGESVRVLAREPTVTTRCVPAPDNAAPDQLLHRSAAVKCDPCTPYGRPKLAATQADIAPVNPDGTYNFGDAKFRVFQGNALGVEPYPLPSLAVDGSGNPMVGNPWSVTIPTTTLVEVECIDGFWIPSAKDCVTLPGGSG